MGYEKTAPEKGFYNFCDDGYKYYKSINCPVATFAKRT